MVFLFFSCHPRQGKNGKSLFLTVHISCWYKNLETWDLMILSLSTLVLCNFLKNGHCILISKRPSKFSCEDSFLYEKLSFSEAPDLVTKPGWGCHDSVFVASAKWDKMWRCTDLPSFLRPDSEPIPQCLFFQKYCLMRSSNVSSFLQRELLSQSSLGIFPVSKSGPWFLIVSNKEKTLDSLFTKKRLQLHCPWACCEFVYECRNKLVGPSCRSGIFHEDWFPSAVVQDVVGVGMVAYIGVGVDGLSGICCSLSHGPQCVCSIRATILFRLFSVESSV